MHYHMYYCYLLPISCFNRFLAGVCAVPTFFVHIYCSHCLIRLFMFIIFVNVKHDEDTTKSFTLGLFWGYDFESLGSRYPAFNQLFRHYNYIFVFLHACECHVISTISMIGSNLRYNIVLCIYIYIYIHNV